ncbi:MAG: 30S ribosomal protein S20 [Actinomycetota bacterium]|nr:30S ribosomal protein S20 [Actinomycetota bacterium]
MANIKSQIKRNRTNEIRRVRNKAARSEIKTRVKRAVQSAETGAETAADELRLAVSRLDKAAARGTIHKNQAANRKSRLVRRINALTADAGNEG